MNTVCAGIVLYNPAIERLIENVRSIVPQVEMVYLVDNGSINSVEIDSLFKKESKVLLLKNQNNLGIAKALNQMCVKANEDGFEWILTLDQDTISPNNLIYELFPFTNDDAIGIVCPAVFFEGWGKQLQSAERITFVNACMTSASLTSLKKWSSVGGFRDDYFIDFVDNEFCIKLRINGYKIIRVNTCKISHQLGDTKTKKILGVFKIKYITHSPLRYYYMTRNNRRFIREYHKFLNVPKEFCKLFYIILKGIIFSENKKDTLHYVLLGYKHALMGKYGSYESNN